MKTYRIEHTRPGADDPYDEWVPAEAAQGLYDIVAKLIEHGEWYPSAIELDTFGGPQGEDLEHEAKTALAAADGEDV